MAMQNSFAVISIYSLTNNLPLLLRSPENPINVVEYNENKFSIEAPKGTCPMGHLLSINGLITFGDKQFHFFVSGKITEVVALPENCEKYKIDMYRFDTLLWSQFKESLQQEQAKIDLLFRSMRDEL